MPSYRRGRINDAVKNELSEILRDVKDPRVADAFVSITAVEVTPDLKFAKVHYSSLMGDKGETHKGLVSAQGYMRKKIAERLNLRITPELNFVADNSIAHGARIAELLRAVDLPREDEEDNSEK